MSDIKRIFTILSRLATRVLPISLGGTGATTASNARINLTGRAGYYASAKGSASSLSLSAGTITAVTLNTWNYRFSTSFEFGDGGIKCPYSGTVLIHAQAYINPVNISCRTGVYVYQNGTELCGNYTLADYAPSVMIMASVKAGDILTLRMRAGAATTGYPENRATHLDVVYLHTEE